MPGLFDDIFEVRDEQAANDLLRHRDEIAEARRTETDELRRKSVLRKVKARSRKEAARIIQRNREIDAEIARRNKQLDAAPAPQISVDIGDAQLIPDEDVVRPRPAPQASVSPPPTGAVDAAFNLDRRANFEDAITLQALDRAAELGVTAPERSPRATELRSAGTQLLHMEALLEQIKRARGDQ